MTLEERVVQLEARVRHLTDREEIRELLMEYGRCLDAKDFDRKVELFAPEGRLELPFGVLTTSDMVEMDTKFVGGYAALWHAYSNLSITVSGDEASAYCYFNSVHVHGADTDHGTIGGAYEISLRRIDGAWRIVVIRDIFVWRSGDQAPGAADGPEATRQADPAYQGG